MAITITLHADPETGAGVDYAAALAGFFDGFRPHLMPWFLGGADEDHAVQIIHLDTPVEGAEAETRAVVLDGADFFYHFATHTVSGALDSVRLVRLADGYDAEAGDLNLEGGLIAGVAPLIEFSSLGIVSPAGVRGTVHEIVAGFMGGGPGGATADPEPFLDAVSAGPHRVFGSAGDDSYTGTRFADTINGGAGDDTLRGAVGADLIRGGAGDDLIFGGAGADTLFGGAGNDTLRGAAGADELRGGAGADRLFGAKGPDLLLGGGGADTLRGGQGNDTLRGGAGADLVFGGAGRDRLFGGMGDDTLDGGAGQDVLTGGAGADVFLFRSAAQADGDRITDFSAAGGDRIDLTGLGGLEFIGTAAFSGTAGELRHEQDGARTLLSGDLDGDGAADFTITLDGAVALSGGDFLL